MCNRDKANLIGDYSNIALSSIITFKCKCNIIESKKLRMIVKTGVFCGRCTKNRKGLYDHEPDNHLNCSVCGIYPEEDEDIINDNWETCWGRNMFFCSNHRVQYPCHNDNCQTDLCNNYHDDKNWKNIIKFWDYDNEKYD